MARFTLRMACVVACLLATSLAHAANPYLVQAREKYQELDYPALPALLAEAVQQPGTTRAEYLEIYKLQGFAYTVLGDTPKAREAFLRLLIVDPAYQLEGSVSPRFRGAFAEARKEFDKQGKLAMQHTPTKAQVKVAEGVDVEVTVLDTLGRVAQGMAEVRTVMGTTEGGFVRVTLQKAGYAGGKHTFKGRLPDPAASLPGAKPAGYYLEYRFAFQNMVGDPVPVGGGRPLYRLLVGDSDTAENGPPPVDPQTGQPTTRGGGGPPLWPLALVGVGGGVAVVALVGVVALGLGTAALAGTACYVQGTCNPTQKSTIGRVTVVVER